MKVPAALAVALTLAGCVTAPKPLQGQFSTLTPEGAVAKQAAGEMVRWGGHIVGVEPRSQSTCFEIVATPLGGSTQPQQVDRSLGRFIACRSGFYEPEVFKAGREVTISGRIDGFESRKVGDYDYQYPRVAADVVYLWPERDDVRIIHDRPFFFGGWYGRRW